MAFITTAELMDPENVSVSMGSPGISVRLARASSGFGPTRPQQLVGAVHVRMIEPVPADVVPFEKQHVEKRRKLGHPAGIGIEPEFDRVELLVDQVARAGLRPPKQDIGAPHVGAPSVAAGIVSIVCVGPGHTPVKLLLELVLARARRWVADLPEVLDKSIALLLGAEIQERLALDLGNQNRGRAVQPLTMPFGQRDPACPARDRHPGSQYDAENKATTKNVH
jgi:hypothetical protein